LRKRRAELAEIWLPDIFGKQIANRTIRLELVTITDVLVNDPVLPHCAVGELLGLSDPCVARYRKREERKPKWED